MLEHPRQQQPPQPEYIDEDPMRTERWVQDTDAHRPPSPPSPEAPVGNVYSERSTRSYRERIERLSRPPLCNIIQDDEWDEQALRTAFNEAFLRQIEGLDEDGRTSMVEKYKEGWWNQLISTGQESSARNWEMMWGDVFQGWTVDDVGDAAEDYKEQLRRRESRTVRGEFNGSDSRQAGTRRATRGEYDGGDLRRMDSRKSTKSGKSRKGKGKCVNQ